MTRAGCCFVENPDNTDAIRPGFLFGAQSVAAGDC